MDFPLKTKKSNISEICLIKRYHEKGFALNAISEMVIDILKGKITLKYKQKNYFIK